MYYKNKNISYSQKKLNIVIKYMKNETNFDRYITPKGLKTDQKVYKNRQKQSLKSYIEKEGNTFESKKKIRENEGIKHLIISPISPELYDNLNKEEKEELENIIKKNIYKDLSRFGFIGGLEHKKRGELEHFHIHIGISERYDISPQNIDYLKRSITKCLLNSNLKDKLELKDKNELLKENYNNKYKKDYELKKGVYNEISILFNEMKNVNKEIKTEYNQINNINFNIGELTKERKREISSINNNKDFLKNDIKNTKEILKSKNESLKNINNNFKELYNNFNNEKDIIKKSIKIELENLQNILNNDLLFFKNFLKFENNIYVKFLKHQLKNKEIDLPTFLYLVSSNKYYQKQRIKYKQEEIKLQLKQREEKLNKRLNSLNNKLKFELNELDNKKEYIELQKQYDEKNLMNLYNKLKEVNKNKKNIIDKSFNRIKILIDYKKEQQQYIQQLQEYKLKKEIELHKKQQQLKMNNNKNTTTTEKQLQQTKPQQQPTTKKKRKFRFGM